MTSLLPPSFQATTLTCAVPQFITDISISQYPIIAGCCQFSLAAFSPELFDILHIELPEHLHSAAKKRQAEYLASRWLVAKLLGCSGIKHWQLGNHPDRSPRWPLGISGSLSHHQSKVFALIAAQSQLVGNDIELTLSQESAHDLANMVMDSTEAAILADAGLPIELATTLIFSIKETVYKAVYPQVKKIFDFTEVKVVGVDNQQVTVRLSSLALPAQLSTNIWKVNYWQSADEVLTWQVISLESPTKGEIISVSSG